MAICGRNGPKSPYQSTQLSETPKSKRKTKITRTQASNAEKAAPNATHADQIERIHPHVGHDLDQFILRDELDLRQRENRRQ